MYDIISRLALKREDAMAHTHQRLAELFQYGLGALLDPRKKQQVLDDRNNTVGDALFHEADRVYQESSTRARAAALQFVHWGKAVLGKDVAGMIGALVWASRHQPATWGVQLDGERE